MQCVRAHFADYALFSVRGVSDDGQLTDPDPLEAELKRTRGARAQHPVLLVDGTKLSHRVGRETRAVRTIIAVEADPVALARFRARPPSISSTPDLGNLGKE